MAKDIVGVGIIGCGNISTTYIGNARLFRGIAVRAIADLRPAVAMAQGAKFGVEAVPVDALLARDDISLVVNLTIPAAHAAVSLAALSAGKHVFSEKPLATDVRLGRKIVAEAAKRKLLVGCAPDTFLGAAGRLARRMVDDGVIGKPIAGAAYIMSHGAEHWHPDPEFFYKPGGGPVLDMGPYYISALVNLLGPVESVVAQTGAGFKHRVVTSESPKKGSRIKVEVPTTALALLQFAAGAKVIFGASWDVWRHGHAPIEIYGEKGSMRVPDPNFFGGVVQVTDKGGDWQTHDSTGLPLGRPNWPAANPHLANYRTLAVAELAAATRRKGKQRASGALALHVLEVMEAILKAGASGRQVRIRDKVARPPALSDADAAAFLA
jgi:predicted dehydrogenase